MKTVIVYCLAAGAALTSFAAAHQLMFLEQINFEERAAYMVFQGICKNDPEALCVEHNTAHNAQGGYIDACEDLPGLVGDDC